MPKRHNLQGAILLKRINVPGLLTSGEARNVELGSLRVPPNTPAGDCHFAYVLRDPKDAYQANNRAWSPEGFDITVTR